MRRSPNPTSVGCWFQRVSGKGIRLGRRIQALYEVITVTAITVVIDCRAIENETLSRLGCFYADMKCEREYLFHGTAWAKFHLRDARESLRTRCRGNGGAKFGRSTPVSFISLLSG